MTRKQAQLPGGPSSTPAATSAGHFRQEGHDSVGVLARQLAALRSPNKHFSSEALAAAEWNAKPFKDWYSNMDKHPLRIALETLDETLLEHSLSEDVVFWTPLLTSTVSGRDFVKRILLTAAAGFGPFQITGEFIDKGGRRMLTWDGAIDGHLIQTALAIVDGPEGKVRELRGYFRPFPVVKLMYDYMHSHLREEIPAPYWVLQEKPA